MIEFRNVWFRYTDDDPYVLKNINLVIDKGELTAIVGENGSGKTTLIKHINGLLKPVKGEVYVDGESTRDIPISKLAEKVSIVFQYPERMFFNPTVKEEMISTLSNFGYTEKEAMDIAIEILSRFGLEDYLERSPFSLSGGEQRRLSIAIALSWSPEYVILDEPTIGLDGTSRKTLIDMIHEILRDGKTVIIVSHDINFILEFKTRLIILNDGEIKYDGPIRMDSNYKIPFHKYGLQPPKIIKLLEMLDIEVTPLYYGKILEELLKRVDCR